MASKTCVDLPPMTATTVNNHLQDSWDSRPRSLFFTANSKEHRSAPVLPALCLYNNKSVKCISCPFLSDGFCPGSCLWWLQWCTALSLCISFAETSHLYDAIHFYCYSRKNTVSSAMCKQILRVVPQGLLLILRHYLLDFYRQFIIDRLLSFWVQVCAWMSRSN